MIDTVISLFHLLLVCLAFLTVPAWYMIVFPPLDGMMTMVSIFLVSVSCVVAGFCCSVQFVVFM